MAVRTVVLLLPPLFLAHIVNATANVATHIAPEDDLYADTASGLLRDADGRQRLFHGTNVVVKLPPFLPTFDAFDAMTSLAQEDFELLQSMGVNVLRVNVPWAAVEPSPNFYDEAWLGRLEVLVNRAGTFGMKVLLDMHQDAMSQKFCGTGMPDWAVLGLDTFPAPLKWPFPNISKGRHPERAECDSINNNQWPLYYVTFAESAAYGQFYHNATIRSAFAAFWAHVAKRFGKNSHVLGYELINEPFAGDVWKNPALFVPAVADRLSLQHLYDEVATAIREVDQQKLVLFQSVTWEILGMAEALGFSHAPGGRQWANRSVLAFHNSVDGRLVPDDRYYSLRQWEARRLGVVAMVTETGSDQLPVLDKHALSWMHWDYKWFANWTWDNPGLFVTSPDGHEPCIDRANLTACLNLEAVKTYARPYARAVAGTLGSFSFDPSTGDAVLKYSPDAACKLPTEVVVPKWQYPAGYEVSIDPPESAEVQAQEVLLLLRPRLVAPITVRITRKPEERRSVFI